MARIGIEVGVECRNEEVRQRSQQYRSIDDGLQLRMNNARVVATQSNRHHPVSMNGPLVHLA
jgi:hypothetical protein